jgi:hypothetical protein
MKITIESTDMITVINGTPCRIWRGVTAGGTKCDVAIPLIRVVNGSDHAEFEEELREMPAPGECQAVSFRSIW